MNVLEKARRVFSRFRRMLTFSFVLALSVFLIARCVPEKAVDFSTKINPVRWLDEEKLLVRIENNYFVRSQDGILFPSSFDAGQSSTARRLNFRMTPSSSSPIWSEDVHSGEIHLRTDQYIEIQGEKHRVGRPSRSVRLDSLNQGFPKGDYVDFYSYLHFGRVGLVSFENGYPRKTELPLWNMENRSSPAVKQDNVADKFLAFQTMCLRDDPDGTCTRTAWWLNTDLEVTSSFLLPVDDPLFSEETFACFSCGCGCYTQEDVYAVNGEAFFHYSGFPLKSSRRGIFKVVELADGTTEWLHLVKGRVEPPLSFSPSGCQVAYFRVSRLGDGLETLELC